MNNFTFIDLFCGIGGFHQAMSSLGGKCVFASDIDKHCRETYYHNYHIQPHGDITKVDEKDIPPHDVICGGFPCQSFSIAGKRLGFDDPTKGTLFFDIVRIIKYHKPKYILLENVKNLASHDNGNTWKVIHDTLQNLNYNVHEQPIIFSPHFINVPQNRERVFIIGIRKDVAELPDFVFDQSTIPTCSINSILQDDTEIPNISNYKLEESYVDVINHWDKFLKGINTVPRFPVWKEWLTDTMDESAPEWRKPHMRRCIELYNNNRTFIDNWLNEADSIEKFNGAKARLEWQVGTVTNNIWETILQFRQSGIRCKAATYFPTLVAIVQTSIIGKTKRYLTPRECARLQSFPDTFEMISPEHECYKQFGNSVNVEVIKLMAKFMFGDPETREKYTETINESYALF